MATHEEIQAAVSLLQSVGITNVPAAAPASPQAQPHQAYPQAVPQQQPPPAGYVAPSNAGEQSYANWLGQKTAQYNGPRSSPGFGIPGLTGPNPWSR